MFQQEGFVYILDTKGKKKAISLKTYLSILINGGIQYDQYGIR